MVLQGPSLEAELVTLHFQGAAILSFSPGTYVHNQGAQSAPSLAAPLKVA